MIKLDNESGKLKRSLGLRHVVFFGLAFMAPGTVFDTYGVAAFQSNGMIAIGVYDSIICDAIYGI